jgi:hypothetical protein
MGWLEGDGVGGGDVVFLEEEVPFVGFPPLAEEEFGVS